MWIKYKVVPAFEYEIKKWNSNETDLMEISIEDQKELFANFGTWEKIVLSLPQIANVIRAMAKKEKILVADYDEYIKQLIEKGIYRFTVDKNGEILPTIRDGKKIVKQVRLKEMDLSPQLNQSLTNLALQAQLAMILDEIEYVGDAIRGIHQELQDDRIGYADSAWDKLKQASKIQDSRLRKMSLLDAVGTATDAKCVLMRNFENAKFYIENRAKEGIYERLKSSDKKNKDIESKAEDAFQDIVSITNCVQIECEGYAMLGEYEAGKECLLQFKSFITNNKLDDRNTLLMLNMNLKNKKPDVVDQFSDIVTRISNYNISLSIGYNNSFHLEEVADE